MNNEKCKKDGNLKISINTSIMIHEKQSKL
jgi:hypothetical protein